MGVIPQYLNKGNLINQGSQVQKNVSEEVRYGAGSQMQILGEAVANVGEQIRKVDNANNTSKADVERTQLLLQAEDNRKGMDARGAVVDAEVQTKKITEQVAKKYFTDPVGKANYLRQQEVQDAGYIIQQTAGIAKKVIQEGRVNVLTKMDLHSSPYINANTEEELLAGRKQLETDMEEGIKLQLFNPEEGYKIVEDKIAKNDETRRSRAKLAARKIKEDVVAFKMAKTAEEKKFYKMYKTKTDEFGKPVDSINLVKSINESPILSDDYKTALIGAASSPKAVAAKTLPSKFYAVMKAMELKSQTQKDGTVKEWDNESIKKTILELKEWGQLSEEDEDTLNEYADTIFGANIDDLAAKPKQAAWGFLNSWSNSNGLKEAESRHRTAVNFMNKLRAGKDPNIAMKETVSEEILTLIPDVATFPSEGAEVMDVHGSMRRIFKDKDGYYTQVNTGTTKKPSEVKK